MIERILRRLDRGETDSQISSAECFHADAKAQSFCHLLISHIPLIRFARPAPVSLICRAIRFNCTQASLLAGSDPQCIGIVPDPLASPESKRLFERFQSILVEKERVLWRTTVDGPALRLGEYTGWPGPCKGRVRPPDDDILAPLPENVC
jgi:hypothetical protein